MTTDKSKNQNAQALILLILILSHDLQLKFVSHTDATPPFRPLADQIGMNIEASEALIRADPDLPLDCSSSMSGVMAPTRSVGEPNENGYLRRISVRPADDGRLKELVVSYEAGLLAPRTELIKVRRRLTNAIEAIPDPVAYFDYEDRLVLCNSAYADLHAGSYPNATVVPGMRFEDILRQDLENGALEISEEAKAEWLFKRLQNHLDPVYETEIRTRDRRWFRVIDRATEDGDRVHVLIDITNLKTARYRLEEVETGARVGMWTFDIVSGSVKLNTNLAEMLGYGPTEQHKIDFDEWCGLAHPDDQGDVEAGFAGCISGEKERCELEFRMQHKKGHYVWVLGSGGVVDRNTEGRVRQIAGVLLDIHRRKMLENELGLRAAAVEAAADAIMITDESGSILDGNPALLRLFRAGNPEAVLGHPWYCLYTREAAADLASEAFPVLRSEQHWQGEAIATRLDGSMFEQRLSMTEMPDGKIVHVSRDISAAKALEREQQALRERVELAQRHEVINLLAAGLTHDLSNLLAVISHLSDPYASAVFEKMDVLAEIHHASRHMVDLLEPLSGCVTISSKSELTDIVEIVRNANKLTALGAPLLLTVESDLPKQPIKTLVDPLRLTQVLMNLSLNARDAIGNNAGKISFALSEASQPPTGLVLDIGQVPDAPFAYMAVSDTGPGIEDNIRQRMWEPYFSSKGDRGTGLGLALIAEIIRDVGGGIALDTSPGRGTTFHILWPLLLKDVSQTLT